MDNKSIIHTEVNDYYVCNRCDKNSDKDVYCPCPRGSCEAEIVGEIEVTITKTIKFKKNGKINKSRNTKSSKSIFR